MNNGEVPDDAFNASSYNLATEPWAARLNRLIGDGAWCAANNLAGEYLLVDLGEKKKVTGISTQGKHGKDGKWIKEYTMSWAHGNNALLPYTVNGSIKVRCILFFFFLKINKLAMWASLSCLWSFIFYVSVDL